MTDRIDHAAEARARIGAHAMDWREPGAAASFAEAQVHATLALVEQQRIANRLLVAQVDQLSAMAETMPGPGYPMSPSISIRQYLTTDDWASIDVPEDDEVSS